MACNHLRELFQLVEKYEIKLAGLDLIRITCPHCGVQETCPARYLDDEGPERSGDDTQQKTGLSAGTE